MQCSRFFHSCIFHSRIFSAPISYSVTDRQVIVLGRTCRMPTGWNLRHWVLAKGRYCSRACRFSYIEETYANIGGQYDRGRSLRSSEHVGIPTLCQSGTKDLLNLRRWAFLFQSFGAGARLQCCLVTWHPVSPLATRTDELYPVLYYLNF